MTSASPKRGPSQAPRRAESPSHTTCLLPLPPPSTPSPADPAGWASGASGRVQHESSLGPGLRALLCHVCPGCGHSLTVRNSGCTGGVQTPRPSTPGLRGPTLPGSRQELGLTPCPSPWPQEDQNCGRSNPRSGQGSKKEPVLVQAVPACALRASVHPKPSEEHAVATSHKHGAPGTRVCRVTLLLAKGKEGKGQRGHRVQGLSPGQAWSTLSS